MSDLRLSATTLLLTLLFVGNANAQQMCAFSECSQVLDALRCDVGGESCVSGTTYPKNHPCLGSGCNAVKNCRPPVVSSEPTIEIVIQPDGKFTALMGFEIDAYWNHEAGDGDNEDDNGNGTLEMLWFNRPLVCQSDASIGFCEFFDSDHARCVVREEDLTCDGAPYDFGEWAFRAQTCGGEGPCNFPLPVPCGFVEDRENVPFVVTPQMLGCKEPPKDGCPEDLGCATCNQCGAGGGAGPGGGGGGFSGAGPGETGPGAQLSYLAGGAGGDDWPGTPIWRTELGLYWSHDYAERIIQDMDDSHVWLITRAATFREFSDLAGGVYATNSPSDEYRTLHRTGGGWELVSLDGTVQVFNGLGRWVSTTDRFGNAKTATHNVMGQLETVNFPDGRSETFAYHPTGKLASITEVGVTATDSRAWTYTWTDDLLDRIDRPDGTALEFFYEDLNFLGYLTRVEKVGTAMGRRVESAWEYDAFGNVAYMWRGDADRLGVNAIDTWEYVFDNPLNPTETIVTDPLGNASTYTIGRDENSNKPRLEGLSGDCPSCSLGPNSTMAYDDMDHPLRATKETDARGHDTIMTYDDNGQVLSRTEAMGEPEERTTTWVYNSTFPALVEWIIQESVEGAPNERLTVMTYNSEGALTERRIEGFERIKGVVSPFSYPTDYTPTPEGQTLSIDPPGYDVGDVTSFVYAPSRGSLLAESRTDPLVGTTLFDYDDYNRRTEVTDPNGGKTVTAFDMANRVTSVTQNGAPDPNDPNPALLTTTNIYNEFGDLERTILPKLNVIEYSYDFAGRLVSIERKPDAATPKERIFYTLDAIGNRVQEDLQRWTGAAWETRSSTEFVYTNRCQLDEVRYPDGSTTEYAYDCEGNLERIWDANHPSNNQTEMASTMYTYDALDRLTDVMQRWGGAGSDLFATTQYLYDIQDHLTQVIDAEDTPTVYQYSDRDLLTQETSIVSGATDHKYNEHGELVETKDARQIVVTRTVDELDRVTQVSYPTPNLNTVYTYDDPAVGFSKGRLTKIERHGFSIDYAYDRFGRLTQDGDLTFGYDDNGNRASVGYPEGVMAIYSHDFADREFSLEVERPGQPAQRIASAAIYEPSGPLASLTLGNGLTETRAFNQRYFPTDIDLAGASTLLDWTYATDNVGNILSITDNQNPSNNRGYTYQDFQYFLTSGNGPWGNQSWTYDQIGNRLSEVRDALPQEDYVYLQNGSGKNTAVLDEIQVASATLRDYQYGVAGHLERVTAGANEILYTSDAEGRLSTITRQAGDARTDFLYDGRSFLTMSAANTATGIFEDGFETGDVRCWTLAVGGGGGPGPTKCDPQPLTRPTYSSDGLLMAANKDESQPTELAKSYFYFAGRPAAQLDVDGGGAASYTWLTTDHLGTPVVATSLAGVESWSGGFEPFGGDYSAASSSGVDLRSPGQWDDASWGEASVGSEQYQNVHRWYGTGTGRYSKGDPQGLEGGINLFRYAASNPIFWTDSLGLKVELYCHRVGAGGDSRLRRAVGAVGASHCFVRIKCNCSSNGSEPYDLRLELDGREGFANGTISGEKNFEFGHNASIAPISPSDWDSDDCSQEDCIRERFNELQGTGYNYPPWGYVLGQNSNTFALDLLRGCGTNRVFLPEGVPPYTEPTWSPTFGPPRPIELGK